MIPISIPGLGMENIEYNCTDEETKRVRAEYGQKLKAMTNELQELVSVSKQHIMTVRSQQTDQKQLDALQQELAHMNKVKVVF